MQKLAAFILIIAFFGQTFSQWFYHLDYRINRASYEQYCINKARPMLKCNGKCQMMKKILEEEKKQQQSAPELKLAAKSEIVSNSEIITPFVPTFTQMEIVSHLPLTVGAPIDQPAQIFHPPA